jgi:energy-coupling factor transport system ATP-binding protein
MKIEIRDLYHTYPTGDEALKGLSFVMEGITPTAIVGQNGSGKTTLVKHLNRILSPTAGSVLIDGVPTTERSTAQWSKRLGYVFQNPDDQLFLSSVRKEFEFGPGRIGIPKEQMEKTLPDIAMLCGLENKLDFHPFDLTATEKKFCAIGSVLMMNPDAVIFDEPTCGQDVEGNRRLTAIVDYLKLMGKLCLTISHDMKFVADNFTRVIVLCHGKVLLDGSCEEVFAQPALLKESFVSPPPICRIAQGLGFAEPVFDAGALVNLIRIRRGGAKI